MLRVVCHALQGNTLQDDGLQGKRKNSREEDGGKVVEEMEKVMEVFLKSLRKQGYSNNTIQAYQCTVKGYFKMYTKVNVKNLVLYREYLLKQYRANTINLKISAMNHFLKFLTDMLKEKNNGTVKETMRTKMDEKTKDQEKNREQELKLWIREITEADEWKRYTLQTVAIQKASFIDNVISQEDYEKLKRCLKQDGLDYWYFVIRYMAATGARVSELVQIKAEHVMLGYMDLCSKGGKVRRIYFPECLANETKRWMEKRGVRSGFLFLNQRGKQITPRGINSQLKKLAVRYGIDPNTVYAHSFRHRFAKNFLERMNDIALLSDLMGHESIETTRVYLKKSTMEQRELIDKMITW